MHSTVSVMVGCGSDTRAYRFQDLLCRHGVKVLECDQPEELFGPSSSMNPLLAGTQVCGVPAGRF